MTVRFSGGNVTTNILSCPACRLPSGLHLGAYLVQHPPPLAVARSAMDFRFHTCHRLASKLPLWFGAQSLLYIASKKQQRDVLAERR